ncbi:MAG: YlxR family protein [Synergistaceae bacterium]|nr:YlxR family protein [Synergistaceae bacterium]
MSVKTSEEKQAKIRVCVGCGSLRPKREMLRIVKNISGSIILDTTGNANARGCYICYDVSCLERALAKNGFIRSLHAAAISKQLKEEITREIWSKKNL